MRIYNKKKIIVKKLILHLWIVGIFLKTLPPLLKATNYSSSLKLNIIFLETLFLLKATYDNFFGKRLKSESFFGYKFKFSNYSEFALLFFEIFGIQEYDFKTKKKTPVIIDCGSSFGMSVAYFKYFYPDAIILAIEANSKTVSLLRENVKRNRFSGVKVLNTLISSSEGVLPFYIGKAEGDWTTGDSGIKSFRIPLGETAKSMVRSVKLSKLITRKLDLLKLDIEGMECEVLKEAKSKLNLVSQVYIEYHGSDKLPRNSLKEILDILKKANFDYKIINTKGWIYRENNFLRIIHALNRNVN